jgi:hypothetical protein
VVARTKLSVAVIGTAFLLAGCGSEEAATPSAPPTQQSSSITTTSSESALPLEGTWRTAPISPTDAEATLRRYGLAKWIKPFRPLVPFGANTTLILDLHEAEWDLYGESANGRREEIDYDAGYVVTGDKVEKIHYTGVTTYRWSLDGDTLTLEFLETTEPPIEGVPDEVFSHALYMTRDFERQD